MPAALIVIASSIVEAKARRMRLDGLGHGDSSPTTLSVALGTDILEIELDKLLPVNLPEKNASQTSRETVCELATEEGLTVRQLAQQLETPIFPLEKVVFPYIKKSIYTYISI